MKQSRRDLLKFAGAAAVASSLAEAAPKGPASGGIPKRLLGKTGVEVSCLALGGHHIGTLPDVKASVRLIHQAIDAGITFMDNAWDYHDGRSELWMGEALKDRRDRVFLMTKCCSHGRDKRTAIEQLEASLRRLKTDHLDLWQIHEVAWDDDPEKHFMKDGAVEALAQAKKEGKVRFIGFTGHKSPELHLKMLSHGFPFDTVQMPINAFDSQFRSFQKEVLPELAKQGIAGIGMKSLNGSAEPIKQGLLTVEEALRYALSQPIATLVSGIDSEKVLRQNLAIVQRFKPMTPEEMKALEQRLAPKAQDGGLELYKTTRRFEGPVGRAQHGMSAEG
ncbi:aldo/keto reductase [Stigmatella hybrida]|uniref:aldo/keto reductase n=1 Tax=Stigmatella hybrida TaxID=394097 RepID=UPI001CDA85B1|nr:aldo/keto reductase [Stigmatella hybrida]